MNLSALLFFLAAVVSARIAWRRGARALAVGAAAMAVLFGLSLWRSTHPLLLAVMILAAGIVVWHRSGATAATVTRWGARIRRKSGVASGTDIARHAGAVAMRRRAPTLRPSLTPADRRERCRQLALLPVTEVGVRLCRVGGQTVWSPQEDVVLVIGGPRKGKTQILAGQVIEHPGAVIVTSTRTDLLDQTAALRAAKGSVYVFNPVGLGGRKSTATFDPLTGCQDPVTAAERASDMLAAGAGYGGRSGDRDFWDDQGRRNLAALLHAAALAGDLAIDVVQVWLSDLNAHGAQITGLLRQHSPEPAFEASVTQFLETNERTRTSITATIAPALAWLTHKPARAAALPAREGGRPLDVVRLLQERGSVFMLGGEEAQVAPLVCAMTGWIAREARRLAAYCPGGRLDPPLGLRLDECALICKVPLHLWTADMGGRGVSIVACFQSRAQIVDHYGEAKAATIINNAGAKVLFGGTGDRDDLQYWSTLSGERDEPITTTDMSGRVASRTTRRVPVLAPAQIHTLPRGRVVVFTSAMPPVIGHAQQAYQRLDVRAVHNPDALDVRARLWAHRTAARVEAWAWREALPLLGALAGLWILTPIGAAQTLAAGRFPAWAGGLAGAFLGITTGLLVGHLAALVWRTGRHRATAWLRPWLQRWLRPPLQWLCARWAAVRIRITGTAGGATHYRPYTRTNPDPAADPPTQPLRLVQAGLPDHPLDSSGRPHPSAAVPPPPWGDAL